MNVNGTSYECMYVCMCLGVLTLLLLSPRFLFPLILLIGSCSSSSVFFLFPSLTSVCVLVCVSVSSILGLLCLLLSRRVPLPLLLLLFCLLSVCGLLLSLPHTHLPSLYQSLRLLVLLENIKSYHIQTYTHTHSHTRYR